MNIRKVGFQDHWQFTELETNRYFNAFLEQVDLSVLINASSSPEDFMLGPGNWLAMHLVELWSQATNKLVSEIEQWAFIKVLYVNFGVVTDANVQKVCVSLAIAIEEDLPHELHYIQQLILIVHQIAQS